MANENQLSNDKKDYRIYIPARRRQYINQQAVIKVTPEAYNALVDVVEESDGLSMKQVASLIIIQAINNGLICFEKERK